MTRCESKSDYIYRPYKVCVRAFVQETRLRDCVGSADAHLDDVALCVLDVAQTFVQLHDEGVELAVRNLIAAIVVNGEEFLEMFRNVMIILLNELEV